MIYKYKPHGYSLCRSNNQYELDCSTFDKDKMIGGDSNAAAEAEESTARRGRKEEAPATTHEAVVANGNEQDDRRGGMDGCLCLRPKRGNAPSSQHGSLNRGRRHRQSRGFNVEMDQINDLL